MARDSQDQRVGDIDGQDAGVQIGQGGRDVINAQNSQVTKNAYYSLFGHRGAEATVDWDRAMQILRQEMLPEIKKRLKDSLFGWAEVDAVEVRTVRLEDSPSLALEAVKLLTVDGGEGEEIDPRMPIIQTYAREDVQGKLLILGTPGAGKTITLLKLAEQLVGEAIAQPQTVIPIIFELSTWKEGQRIEDWLIEQLYENYGGNRKRKIYETWLEQRVLLPLMDGLDELGLVQQRESTKAVNEFARTYPQVVVCCRVKEFQQAGVNLENLRGIVQLQSLSDNQIQNYLDQLGKIRLWNQLQSVPEMQKLLQPVVNLDEEIHIYLSTRDNLKRWEQIIQAAREMQHILKPLLELNDFSLSDAEVWAYLAPMGKANLFYLVSQANSEVQNFLKTIVNTFEPNITVESGLLRIPLFVNLAARAYDPKKPLRGKSDLLEQYIDRQLRRDIRENDRRQKMSRRKWAFKTLEKETDWRKTRKSLSWIARQMQIHDQVDLSIEQMQPSWLITTMARQRYKLVSGLAFGLPGGLALGLTSGLANGLTSGLANGILGGLAFGLTGGLAGEYERAGILLFENTRRAVSPQPKTETLYNLQYLMICMLIGASLGELIGKLASVNIGWAIGIVIALIQSFRRQSDSSQGIIKRWISSVHHLSLMIVLSLSEKVIPWKFTQFLDYCTERRLLQKIGGRYRFIHRELLDHFATMPDRPN
jgi:NACHT domain